jgi:hypothetical protein
MIVGEWTPLAGPGGTLLALAGDHTAAAQRGRLTVWDGERELVAVESGLTGRPSFGAGELRCGELVVSLPDGAVRRLDGVQAALGEGTGVAPLPPPGGGYRAAGFAWAADGEALVAGVGWTGPPGPPAARAVLLDGSGRHTATLWEGSDRAPAAVWAGAELIAVGTREPRVYARTGELVMLLDAGAPPIRLEADERSLLVVEHARIALWDPVTWRTVTQWEGGWLDATLAPGRDVAVAVDLSGALHALPLEGGAPVPLGAPDPVQAIAVGERRIVASFARGAQVRTAALD